MKRLVLLIFLGLIGVSANAQCKRVAKKCVKGLDPFIYNGQVNQTILTEGESASVTLSFQSEVEYRLTTCGDRFFTAVKMEVFDEYENLIYSNEDDDFAGTWDFELDEARNLLVKITVPLSPDQNEDIAYRGCVALLVGAMND